MIFRRRAARTKMYLKKGTASVALLLVIAVSYGEALKCYQGALETKKEGECSTSCMKVDSGVAGVFYSCSPKAMGDDCNSAEGITTCYCKTDLCNGAAGLSVLNITWLAAISVILGKLYLN